MSADIHRRTTCRLCGAGDLAKVLALPATPPANAFVPAERLGQPQDCYPLDVYFCRGCGHLQLLDVVDPEILFRDYVYVSGTSPAFVRHFQDYAADCIARFELPRQSLVVDIGSNDGTLLKFFQQAGLDVLGVDPAAKIAEEATTRGIETWPEFLDSDLALRILSEKGLARLVLANNVFAHVDDLNGFVQSMSDFTAADSIFVFEVSYAADVHAHVLFDTIYHEHLDYHTVKPLVPFFARHGMELFAVRRVPTHGGSIRGFVQRSGGKQRPDGSVVALIAEEEARGLDTEREWLSFSSRIDRVGQELTSLLTTLKREGKRIAGFGAPAKATTLMYRFGLGQDVIDYIVDDSPLKQSLYTPGRHIPVVPWSKTEESRPDYMVILAWNFADPIVAGHRAYLDAGGHFIVPLPEVRVI